MKFDFKSVPLPSRAKKKMPEGATNTAFKVRHEDKVLGIVLHSEIEGGELWGFFLDNEVTGGFNSRQSAALALYGMKEAEVA